MKKFLTIFLTVLSFACLVGGLAACGGNDGKIDYTVAVYSIGGDKLRNVSVEIKTTDLSSVAKGKTDRTGTYTVRLKPGDYNAQIIDSAEELPAGYSFPEGEDLPKRMTEEKTKAEFRLSSSIITDKALPENKIYSEGDVMYDYTVTPIFADGKEETTFSELLKEKKMIFVNLWAPTCTYCVQEFPYMFEALHTEYQILNPETGEYTTGTYADEVAVVLISSWTQDSLASVNEWKNLNYPDENEPYWVYDPSYCSHFVTGGNIPASIVIDRYGVFSYFEAGSMPAASAFTRVFDKYCSPNYSQSIERPNDDGEIVVERPLNPYTAPSSTEIAAAVNGMNRKDGKDTGSKFNGTYHAEVDTKDKDYSWPWFVSEDGTYIYNSNKGVQKYSFATVYLNYRAEKGQVLAFDYYSDLENGYDLLYVFYNNRQQSATLTGKTDGWQTCYLDVAKDNGNYEVIFFYNADERNPDNSQVEDVIKIKNIHLTDAKDMESEGTYLDILFDCTSDFDVNRGIWKNYENVGLNQNDGFYHLREGAEPTGPIVYLNTRTASHFSDISLYQYANDGQLKNVDGIDYTDFIFNYCNFAMYSDYATYVPVTEELQIALDKITRYLGSGGDKEWLEMCVYFVRYGANEASANPIEGMAHFTAYTLDKVTTTAYTDADYKNGIDRDLNKIEIKKQPLPRGTYFEFTPEADGVYELRTFGDYATICWIVDGDIVSSFVNKGDMPTLNHETFYDKNFTEYVPMYKGHTYYILLDLYDQVDPTVFEKDNPGVLATFYLSIRNMGASHTALTHAASPNAYTTNFTGIGGDAWSGNIIITLFADGYNDGEDGLELSYKDNPAKKYPNRTSSVYVDLMTPNGITIQYNDLEKPEYAEKRSLADVFTRETFLVPKYDARGNLVVENGKIVWMDLLKEEDGGLSADEIAYMKEKIAQAQAGEEGAPEGMVRVDAKLEDVLNHIAHICSDFRASAPNADGSANYVKNEFLQMCYYYRTYAI